jgi:hypothetical protein
VIKRKSVNSSKLRRISSGIPRGAAAQGITQPSPVWPGAHRRPVGTLFWRGRRRPWLRRARRRRSGGQLPRADAPPAARTRSPGAPQSAGAFASPTRPVTLGRPPPPECASVRRRPLGQSSGKGNGRLRENTRFKNSDY